MADIDVNIARSVQVPDAMKSISGMLNFANQAQQFQSNNQALEKQNIELQKSRQANTERMALQQFMQNPDNWQTDGKIDVSKLNSAIPKIAPYTGSEIMEKLTALGNAQTTANEAALKLTQGKREVIGSAIGVLGRAGVADPKVYSQALDDLRTLYKDDADFGRLVDSYKSILGVTQAGPGIPKAAITAAQSLLSPAQQQQTLTPTAGLTNTGGEVAETITQPSVGGNAPSVSLTGRAAPLTLPPTATEFKPGATAPTYVGNAPGGRPAQSGPALGAEAAATGTAQNSTKDWGSVQEAAKTAAQDIGVLQEIKKYAKGAVTGVESDRRAYLAGLAGLVGMTPEQIARTDTDLLAKNAAMLASQRGDSDLARTLTEMSNPNAKMTPEAIEKASNQVIAQRQLSLARQQYLQPFINDPVAYNRAVTEFNQIADPRVLQLQSMTPAEKAKMKASMSPKEAADFSEKIRAFYRLGIIK